MQGLRPDGTACREPTTHLVGMLRTETRGRQELEALIQLITWRHGDRWVRALHM
jgi:hypothetical protein